MLLNLVIEQFMSYWEARMALVVDALSSPSLAVKVI